MIPTLPFGRTGHESTRLIFGAAALGLMPDESEAAPVLELLLEAGVNHIDVAASYGRAERRVGEWMPEHREHFYLATKTDQRTHEGARTQLQKSLERLQTDHVDLIQLHNLVKTDEWETAFSDEGAVRALVEAREEGLVRHLGVTGHGTQVAAMHLRSLAQFDFDSVLLPYNHPMMSQPEYAEDFELLLEACEEQQVAVQTIKSVARRRWDDGTKPFTTTWYEPITGDDDLRRAVHWALARPGIFVNSASDAGLLPKIIEAAQCFASSMPPADEEMDAAAKELAIAPLFVRGYDDVRLPR